MTATATKKPTYTFFDINKMTDKQIEQIEKAIALVSEEAQQIADGEKTSIYAKTTKNAYAYYMTGLNIDNSPKWMKMILAEAVIRKGGNVQGIKDALKIIGIY